MSTEKNSIIMKAITDALGEEAKHFKITPDLENILVDDEDHYCITFTFLPNWSHPEFKVVAQSDCLEFSIFDNEVHHTYGEGEDCQVTKDSIYSFLYWGLAVGEKDPRAIAVMDFANGLIGAFDANFVEEHTLTLATLHRCAQNHVKDTYKEDVPHLAKAWGDDVARFCKEGNATIEEVKNQQLKAEIKNEKLEISIGTHVLCFAVEHGDTVHQEAHFKITNGEVFAKEILTELMREEEDGTTLLHLAFDKAASNAFDQGAEGVEFNKERD